MKITDLRCAIIGGQPVIRIKTDEGIDGYGSAARLRSAHIRWHVEHYRDLILGSDPTDVERTMLKIRRLGAFKPWGSSVSGIEVALWDIAGKAANVPVYKLLGGKVRDRVRVYNGAIRSPLSAKNPEDYAESSARMKDLPQGFTIIKQAISFHGKMDADVPDYYYGDNQGVSIPGRHPSPSYPNRGLLTEKGFDHTVNCVVAMKEVLGDEIGLALDCGPGMTVTDTLKLAQALEPYNIMWLEDTVRGDFSSSVDPDLFLQITPHTTTPIHTGEQIYLRENFKNLIQHKAVNIVGPDPLDVGGIAEMKWIAQYADLHGILFAPHGIGVGLIGLAAQIQAAATYPDNFIAFEYSTGRPDWWYDIVHGLPGLQGQPETIVRDGFVDVLDRPGLGITLDVEIAQQYLGSEDKNFFD